MQQSRLSEKINKLSRNQQITETLSNLRQGDAVVLDIDGLLLRHESDKHGEESLSLIDKNLPNLLRYLHETGHPIILLTTHIDKYFDETTAQLAKLGLNHVTYTLLHAPEHNEEKKLIEHIKSDTDKFKNIKRLHIVDGNLEKLENIEHALSEDADYSKIARLHYHYQPKTQLLINLNRPDTFPATLERLSNPIGLGGGTASTFKVKENRQQQDYVLKYGHSQAQIKIEILMNVLYERLGVPVPKVQAYQSMPQILAKSLSLGQVTQTIQLSEYLDQANPQNEQAIVEQACRDFVIHAFIGNIDIAKTDNFIQTTNDEVKLIDSGANFLFRALGGSRDEETHTVNEIHDMRNPEKNPSAAKWFKHLTDKDIKNQVEALMSKRKVIEQTIWDISQQLELPASLQLQLLAGFSHRLDDLAQHYGFVIQPFAKRDKAAIEGKTAAGVMHLQRNESDELCVLLSKRVGHGWCDNFGGKSDDGDNMLAYTAQREVNEESNGVLRYSDRELAEASFHDIITLDEQGEQYLYRMYFVTALQPTNIKKLKDNEHIAHYWVPVRNLQTALLENLPITAEDQITIQVKDENGVNLIVFPPLYEMLKQQPVLTLIDGYVTDELVVTRTQGLASNVPIEKAKEKNQYRPLASPSQVKADIVVTQLNKAKILDDIKHQRHALGGSDLFLMPTRPNDYEETSVNPHNL